MDSDLTEQVISNTRDIKSMQNQRRSTIVRVYGEEHTAEFVNGTATFYLPVDTDMQYMSELKFKLLSGNVGSDGTIDNPSGGHVEPGTATYTTMKAWLEAYPVGTYVDMDGYYGAQSLVAGTQLLGADGIYRSVETLKEGDRVLARDGKTVNTIANNNATLEEIWEVRTWNGYIRGTAGHKMFSNGKKVRLDELRVGDYIDFPDNPIPTVKCPLTPNEARFFGFWLGDGTRKLPEVTIGSKRKQRYLDSLGLNFHRRRHSNGKAWIYTLRNSPAVKKLINKYPDKTIPIFGEREKEIIEGLANADGTPKHDGICITNTNFAMLTAVQEMCWKVGYCAAMGKVEYREGTNLCDNPKPIRRLTINFSPRRRFVRNKVLSVKKTREKEYVYHTNVWEDNHSYIADGLASKNCWDYADAFWVAQVNRMLQTGPHSSASDTWRHSREVNAGTEFGTFASKSLIKRGDWIVMSSSEGAIGHIALAAEDYNGTNYLLCYGQNQGGTPVPRGGAAISLNSIPIGDFVGGFRYAGWTTTDPT